MAGDDELPDRDEVPSHSGFGPQSAGFFRWADPITAGPREVCLPSGEEVPAVQFGPFQLLGQLGTGGMARVYLAARNDRLEDLLALKVLGAAHCRQAGSRAAFRDEARLSAQLVHRNIVRTREDGEVDGRLYFAMDRFPGWNLAQLLSVLRPANALPPEPVIAAIALGVARGMAYAHTLSDREGRPLRVVHRDLKPGNVMIDGEGQVKVVDFGIARWAHREATTGQGWVKGTVAFMSPEQVLELPLTGRSDVFALGSLICALALGSPPFERDRLDDAGEAILKADLGPHRAALVAALPRLHSLVQRCLQRVAMERPSAAGVVAELEALTELGPPDLLADWMEEARPLLSPLPGPGSWPEEGPPEGMRRTRVGARLQPR